MSYRMPKRLNDEVLRRIKDHVDAGDVRCSEHPGGGLFIYNYTEKCAYSRNWNPITLMCRGLILDEDGRVIARGMNKFFNYGEPEAPKLGEFTICSVHDKIDGSLGILYPGPDGRLAVATRGSFKSDQALKGTEILREKYHGWEPRNPEVTYLFEIVYPENRIVLDYGQTEDLIMLGTVDNDSGIFYPADVFMQWQGPRAEVISRYSTIGKALAMPPRPNAEGLVLRTLQGSLVKIKQDDYVQLHKVVTNLTTTRVWEAMRDGMLDDVLAALPEPFKSDAELMSQQIWYRYQELEAGAQAVHRYALAASGGDRKKYAEIVKPFPKNGLMFQLLDGKDLAPSLWKFAKPGSDNE